MTEAEWLAADHPWPLLNYARSRAIARKPSVRKVRLFACACCRRVWGRLNQAQRQAVEAAEQFADRLASDKQLTAARERSLVGDGPRPGPNPARYAAAPTRNLRSHVLECVLRCMIVMLTEKVAHCALFRCVVGNPFRTSGFDPGRLTPGAVTVAQGAYEERLLPSGELEADRLAILTDALEEAGCADADMLGHLRGPGPHVRGCWVVDLLLGQS
jgi:hypothetical protein